MGGAIDAGSIGSWALGRLTGHAVTLASAVRGLAGLLPAPAAADTPLQQVNWAAVVAADPQITVPTGRQCGYGVLGPCVGLTADVGIPRDAPPSLEISGYVASDRVLYGDLVGAGGEEAVVPIGACSFPGFVGFLVYRATADGPQLVTSAAGYHLSLEIAGGALQVSRPRGDLCAAGAASCPSTVVTTSYTLVGGTLVVTGESEEPLAKYLGVPSEVLALLPPGSDLRAGLAADVTGDGTTRWVLLYEAPTVQPYPPGGPGVGGHLVVVSPTADGWAITRDFPVGFVGVPGFLGSDTINRREIAGTPAVILQGPLTSRGTSGLVVVRWDGADFQDVFHDINDGQGLDLADRSGDGVPEVVDRQLSGCGLTYDTGPYLLTVFRWDGAAFSDATGQYPALLSQAEADAQTTLAAELADLAPGGTAANIASRAPFVTACVHALLAVLAAKGGDMATAAAECDQARAAAQDRDVLMAAMAGMPPAGELCMPDEGGSQ